MKKLLLCALLFALLPLHAQPPLAPAADLEASLKKARVGGKNSMLLAQFNMPQDEAQYGAFADNGLSQTTEWQGFKDLPPGYWVYVAPYWYIWRDQVQAKRSWGPEQAIGEPDTPLMGDTPTAWASRSQDESDEWLLLEYATPVMATSVRIFETHNPGAINKVSVFTLNGKEEVIWAGVAAPVNNPNVVGNEKQFARPLKTNRVKIYLDSKKVPGWNEIDAVGLVDREGHVQWAANVAASSTYAEQGGLNGVAVPGADRLLLLEQAVRQMQMDINELRQRAGLPPRPLLPNPQANVDLLLGERLRENVLVFDGAIPAQVEGRALPMKIKPVPVPIPLKDPKPAPDAAK